MTFSCVPYRGESKIQILRHLVHYSLRYMALTR